MKNRGYQASCLATCVLVAVIGVAIWIPYEWNRSRRSDSPTNASKESRQFAKEPAGSDRPAATIDSSIVDYIGSTACRDCHSEIWEKYQSHPMANSFSKVSSASPLEDYLEKTEFAPPGNRSYRVEKTADQVLHHEIMKDSHTDVIYDQSVPVEYTIGSGKRGRGYVIDHDGILFKSSISWYSDEHRWGLSPDYLPERHQRFERRVTGGCLACHAGLPNFVRDEADKFGQPPFLEEAIGCERCHGPGRKHVAARESGDVANDPIVNPSRLDTDPRESVCAQCHLHGESRVLRTGRTPHDFRPGQRLDDNWIVFVKSHGTGVTRSGRAASQVEHMVSSVCYQRSQGQMGCASCHDPHSIPSSSEKVEYFRQRCLKCHSERGCSLPLSDREAAPNFDNCVKCHMPSVASSNVLHRSVADHRILRRPSEDNEQARGESKVFQFTEASIPQSERDRAKAIKLIENAIGPPFRPELAEEAKQLLLPLIAESPNDPEIYAAMGNIFQIQKQPIEATRWRLRVLELNPRHEKTVQSLAEVFHDEHQLAQAEIYLKRFLELNPWHGAYHGRLAVVLMQRGDTKAAIASAERALELNPTIWQLDELLAEAYQRIGNHEASARHRALLNRKHPTEVRIDR